MQREFYRISKKDLFDLFARLSEGNRVFVPYKSGERLTFGEFDASREDAIELGMVRQSQPFKSFIYRSRMSVFGSSNPEPKPVIVAGVKGCDLQSLIIQDYVFQEGEHKDVFYMKDRENTLIIASDCTQAKETCFCLAMEGAPYPKSYFDINLSQIDNNFIVEAATSKGIALIDRYRTFFKDSTHHDIEIRDKNRLKVAGHVKDAIDKRGTPSTAEIKGAVKKNYSLIELWKDVSSTCVECGACNLVCPTCHCFLLYDTSGRGEADRLRIWDACLYNTFARVAGGANPRRHLYERMRNRFEKKFDFFPQIVNYYACTGCGRCIDACPGDIDIREVLKGLVKGAWNKPPHD